MAIPKPFLLLIFLLAVATRRSSADIRSMEVRSDARTIIPFDEFGFARAAGVLELNVSGISLSDPNPDLDLSQLGFFLATRDAWLRVVAQIQSLDVTCPLQSDLVVLVFTLDRLRSSSPSPFRAADFSSVTNVSVPDQYTLLFARPPLSPMHAMPWLVITPLLIVLVFFFFIFLLLIHANFNTTNRPPSPFKLPIIGNLHQLGPLPHRSLAALSRKHGPLMLLHLGQVPALVVSSPDAVREVMKTQDHIFADRPSLKVPGRLLYGCKDIAFARYGEYWRSMRKLSVVHFLSPSKVRTYVKVREEEVGFMISKISRSCSCGGAALNLSEVLVPFAKDVISRIVLGTCSRDERWNEAIDEVIEESNELLGTFNFGDYIPRLSWLSAATGLDAKVERTFRKLDRVLEEIVEGCIDRHCARPRPREDGLEHRTLVDVLLSLQKDPSVEISLTKENIKALIEDIFGAGMDSTLIVLEWCMAELMRNPEVMKKLQKEVREVATPKEMVAEDDLAHMSYLKAVIKEILRFHPPGPLLIPRRSMEHTNVQGYRVPKEAMVIVNCWAICRDDAYWEAPGEFRPERFESSSVDFKGNDFQLIPFGAGRRACPGLHLANSIVELALANLVYCFNWTLPGGTKKEDMDVEEAPGITSRKRTSLHIIAEPAHSDQACT